MKNLIITEPDELKSIIKAALIEIRENEKQELLSDRLFNRNQVSKRLGKAWRTVDKLISKGLIKTTKDGLISEAAIQDYLQNN